MLETIREYAAELLDGWLETGGVQAAPRRDTSCAMAEEAEPNLRGIESHTEWLDRLEREHDNLRAALDRLEASGETAAPALRLAAALWRFWDLSGYLGGRPASSRDDPRRRRAPDGRSGHERSAERLTWRSRAESRDGKLGDRRSARAPPPGQRRLRHRLFAAHGRLRRRAGGRLGESAAALRRERHDGSGSSETSITLCDAAGALAWAFYEDGDLEPARESCIEDDLRPRRVRHTTWVLGDERSANSPTSRSGEGRLEDAVSMLTKSHRVLRDAGRSSADRGRGASLRSNPRPHGTGGARRHGYLSSSAVLLEEWGADPLGREDQPTRPRTVILAQLDEAAFAEGWEQGRTLTADEAVTLALAELSYGALGPALAAEITLGSGSRHRVRRQHQGGQPCASSH